MLWAYATASLVCMSAWKFLLYTSFCLFVCFTVYEKLKTCFDSIKLKCEPRELMAVVHVVLFYYIIRGLVPCRSSRVGQTVFYNLPSFPVSKRLSTPFEPFEPYNNMAEETNVQSRWAICTHLGVGGLAQGPDCPWPLKPLSPHWDLRGWFSALLSWSGPGRWYIKTITRSKRQPCLGSGIKLEGCA